jgi:hypothetical protein
VMVSFLFLSPQHISNSSFWFRIIGTLRVVVFGDWLPNHVW